MSEPEARVEVGSIGRRAASQVVVRDERACAPAPATPAIDSVTSKSCARSRLVVHNHGMAPRRSRVLIVDDNADAADMLAEALRMMGHQVKVLHDGAAALAVDHTTFDVGILDIGLPSVDGWTLSRSLRARGAKLPLIAVSGYGTPFDRATSLAAGFDAHFAKPVDLSTLVSTMGRLRGDSELGSE